MITEDEHVLSHFIGEGFVSVQTVVEACPHHDPEVVECAVARLLTKGHLTHATHQGEDVFAITETGMHYASLPGLLGRHRTEIEALKIAAMEAAGPGVPDSGLEVLLLLAAAVQSTPAVQRPTLSGIAAAVVAATDMMELVVAPWTSVTEGEA